MGWKRVGGRALQTLPIAHRTLRKQLKAESEKRYELAMFAFRERESDATVLKIIAIQMNIKYQK